MSNQENTLGIVPDDWNVLALGDLGSWGGGSTPRKSNHEYWGGSMPWVSPKDMGESVVQRTEDHVTEEALSQTNLSVYRPGSVVVVFRSGVLRHTFPVATLDQPFTVNQDMKVLTTREEVDDRFVFHLLRCMGPLVLQRATKVGTTVESVDTMSFKSLPVGVPAFREQRRIADVLDTVDAAIRETDDVIAKQERVKTGLLQDLLTRGLDADGQLRDPEKEPGAFRETEIGTIPVDWNVVRLLDHVSLPSGQVDPRTEPYRDWMLVAPNHVEEGTGRLVAQETASEQGAKSGKYVFSKGDVVYSKIRPYLRKAWLATQEGICSADMYPLRSGKDILPEILEAIILGEHFSRFAEMVSMRSGIPKINRDELGEYVTALPPIDEQERITKVLEWHDSRVAAEQRHRDKMTSLKTGLMQDLLTGRVRVPEAEERVEEITR